MIREATKDSDDRDEQAKRRRDDEAKRRTASKAFQVFAKHWYGVCYHSVDRAVEWMQSEMSVPDPEARYLLELYSAMYGPELMRHVLKERPRLLAGHEID